MKHLNLLLLIGILLGFSSCQTDVERADSLRLQNKFDEAAQLYQKAADAGDAYAMWRLFIAYNNGDGVDYDQDKAFSFLQEASKRGCKEAQADLSRAYMSGWNGVTPDSVKGKQVFDELVANNSDNAYIQAHYVSLLLDGVDGVYDKNTEKAVRILKQIDDDSDPYFLYIKGWVYWNGVENIEKDITKAIEYFTESFERGGRYSAHELAHIYLTEDDANKNIYNKEKGIEWLKKGVDSNSTDAMLYLAHIYLCSEDDKKFKLYRNPRRGVELLEKAARHGSGEAYMELGMLYNEGINVDKDDNKFYEYNKKGYDLGNAAAANNLGGCYLNGTGCEKDVKRAISIWKKAVKMGSGFAAVNLFRLYRYGKADDGIPVNYDREKAKYYLLEGAKLKEPFAWLQLSYQYYPGGDLFNKDSHQAFVYAKKAADVGDVSGCELVAYLLDNGIGCSKNPKEAQRYRDKYEVQKKGKQ